MAFLNIPPFMEDLKAWCRLMAQTINSIMQGKTNNTCPTDMLVTLTANTTTTTVTEAPNRIGEYTLVVFVPTTANAAAAMTNVYVSSRTVSSNTFTITHANNAQTDRIFSYVLVG